MALDTIALQRQTTILAEQIEDLHAVRRELISYRKKLNAAWKGEEMTYLNRVIDDLTNRCSKLEQRLESLEKDISTAAQEILTEEAEAAAAAAALTGLNFDIF